MDREKLTDMADEVQRYAAYIKHLAGCIEEAETEPSNGAEATGKVLALCESIQMMSDKIDAAVDVMWKEDWQ